MIYLSDLSKVGTEEWVVGSIHYMPFDPTHGLGKTREELSKTGMFIDKLPEPELVKDSTSLLCVNPERGDAWYKYERIPEQPNGEFPEGSIDMLADTMREEMKTMQEAIDFLIMGGGV